MKEKKVCSYCFNWIEGGTYLDRDKRYYFCSNDCLTKWGKENAKET